MGEAPLDIEVKEVLEVRTCCAQGLGGQAEAPSSQGVNRDNGRGMRKREWHGKAPVRLYPSVERDHGLATKNARACASSGRAVPCPATSTSRAK